MKGNAVLFAEWLKNRKILSRFPTTKTAVRLRGRSSRGNRRKSQKKASASERTERSQSIRSDFSIQSVWRSGSTRKQNTKPTLSSLTKSKYGTGEPDLRPERRRPKIILSSSNSFKWVGLKRQWGAIKQNGVYDRGTTKVRQASHLSGSILPRSTRAISGDEEATNPTKDEETVY